MKSIYIVIISMLAIISAIFIYCSGNSNPSDDTTGDVGIKPSSQICPKLPKCFNNAYPPFIGYDKASCMKTINTFDEALIQELLDANGDCDQYKNLLMDFQLTEGCKVLQACLDAKIFNERLGGSIDGCKDVLKTENISLELEQCIYSAYRNNNDCNGVNLCINIAQADVGFDTIFTDTGVEKACVTDTDSYNCEFVCDKFHSCTNLYCPPENGDCTRDDCINGCKDPVGQFTIELMCCLAEKSCEEISQCY
ncbi:MAG: hypothetical protein ACP5QK_08210 [Myxococcota bacterium]